MACAWHCSNGIAMQRARIILPLAFLVRANDTAEHRQWLQTAVDGFLTRQHCEGTWCAYKEELSHPGWGGSTRVPNNDDCAHKLLTFASGLVGLTRRSRSQTERLRRRSTRPTPTRCRTSSVRRNTFSLRVNRLPKPDGSVLQTRRTLRCSGCTRRPRRSATPRSRPRKTSWQTSACASKGARRSSR